MKRLLVMVMFVLFSMIIPVVSGAQEAAAIERYFLWRIQLGQPSFPSGWKSIESVRLTPAATVQGNVWLDSLTDSPLPFTRDLTPETHVKEYQDQNGVLVGIEYYIPRASLSRVDKLHMTYQPDDCHPGPTLEFRILEESNQEPSVLVLVENSTGKLAVVRFEGKEIPLQVDEVHQIEGTGVVGNISVVFPAGGHCANLIWDFGLSRIYLPTIIR